MKTHILVVDDEQEIADLVEVYLTNEGFTVYKYYNAEGALACLMENEITLAVLDVMLPDMNGFELLKRIREHYYFPVIMLTARVEAMDKINGLSLGADDYITKPFHPLELVARVKSQLRRAGAYNHAAGAVNIEGAQQEELLIDINGLLLDIESHTCTLYGKPVSLTPTEYAILQYLCERRGKVVSSEELFEAVWKEKYFDGNNTVMTHIARLREKLKEPPRKPKIIKTVWGVGYKIE